ncbi:FAD-dependent oxidoreductase [Halapricum desulfuricans]|uniref:CoA-dependent NAD(P)H Sulfur Oxidoreductase n=1 Tax=Halapricum desulfuricans TaxID=2841257 RepID=A0A897N9K5_9EURY|nr:FAD-dependent oxidoreductase [Halapricum desulfuricans]QSG09377.1 CoA-dependent NAD(P)H Sulfur Oxidoreductase [Halapricum desulfuricans]
MAEPFVIVGGDAAGMSAASKARREAPDREIVVLERGKWVSYGACGLPYYVKGDVESLEDLVAVPPEKFIDERDIDLRTGHEGIAIDTDAGTVTVRSDEETYEQSYGDLLIATGARALEPPIDGLDLDGVFTLHSMDAGAEIKSYVENGDLDSVAVIGGGYVGIEMAEAFDAHGLDVTLFEMLPQVLSTFGESVGEAVGEHLREQGVDVRLSTRVERLAGDGTIEAVETEDGTVSVDAALVGAGVVPNAELAEQAGVELGETGAIATDEYGRTNVENVYAAGDVAEMTHTVTGEPDHVPLALTANRAGRAIGQTVTGTETPVGEIAGTAVVKAFDLAAARTGITDEAEARQAGFEPVSVTINAPSRAHYYPGGDELELTMVADRETERVLGASIVGREGVAKRIDTVATALHEGMTVEDVEYLDLAYAPPFSPTWDPVLTTAKVLNGQLE